MTSVVGEAERNDIAEHLVQPAVVQMEVDEPWPRQFDPLDVRRWVGGQPFRQLRRQLARVAPGGLRSGERDVRRPVPVLATGRPLEMHGHGRVDPRGHEGVT